MIDVPKNVLDISPSDLTDEQMDNIVIIVHSVLAEYINEIGLNI
jgi:hypothetical protein